LARLGTLSTHFCKAGEILGKNDEKSKRHPSHFRNRKAEILARDLDFSRDLRAFQKNIPVRLLGGQGSLMQFLVSNLVPRSFKGTF
jgi:hypothetical protein